MFEKLLIKLQLHVIGKLLNYKLHPITLKIVINYNNYKLQTAITPSLMNTNNIRLCGEITKIIPKLLSNTLLICSTEFMVYRKIPKYSNTRKMALIILKFEQCSSNIE